MKKITCWLKIRKRDNNLDFVLKCLNGWLATFGNREKYRIMIYSEDIDLPREYSNYQVIRKFDLLQDVQCKKLYETIQSSTLITPHWKGAFMALSSCYFYDDESDLIWNCDCDDLIIYGPMKHYFRQVEAMFQDPKIYTMSADLHVSKHLGDFFPKRPHHWSFGINLSRREFMKKLILKSLMKPVPNLGWGQNLDLMIDLQLEKIDTPYVAFITPSKLVHQWGLHENGRKTVQYNLETNKVESFLCGLFDVHEKSPRSVLIQ